MKIISNEEYRELLKDRAFLVDVQREFNELITKHRRLDEECEYKIKKNIQELELLVQDRLRVVKDENQTLTIENANLKQKVEMYEKAFENLGFDVKDMKEILNKLVDGLISKNTIQLVK